MHEYLKSIGFSGIKTKKQMNDLIRWCTDAPDRMSVISLENESNLAVCEKQVASGSYLSVVGELDEKGTLIPEYYFPYTSMETISSEAHLSYKKEHARDGYIGMCEDYRLGMALIFQVTNIAEVKKNELRGPLQENFTRLSLSALASDATVILPLYVPQAVLKRNQEDLERHARLTEEAQQGSADAVEILANDDIKHYQEIMQKLPNSDVYTLVESFFMPSGMESDEYYFFGEIRSLQECRNEYTGEKFYRLGVTANGMDLMVAVNSDDLRGMPYIGARLKCHAWLTGVLRK